MDLNNPVIRYLLYNAGGAVAGSVLQSIENALAALARRRLYDQAEAQYKTLLPTLVEGSNSRLQTLYGEIGKRQAEGYGRRGMARSGGAAAAAQGLESQRANATVEAEANIRNMIAQNLANIKMGRAQEIAPGTTGATLSSVAGSLLGNPEYIKTLARYNPNSTDFIGNPEPSPANYQGYLPDWTPEVEPPSYEEIIKRRAKDVYSGIYG